KKNDFETPPVRVVILALRLANARHDREILRRLCVAWEALTGAIVEVEEVVGGSTLVGGDFLRAWAEVTAQPSADAEGSLLTGLRESLVERLDFPGVVDWFIDAEWNKWDSDFGDDL